MLGGNSAHTKVCGIFLYVQHRQNIVRSLDTLTKNEYTYTYEDDRIIRAAESDIMP